MSKKSGLGKGLGALIPPSPGQWEPRETADQAGVLEVPVNEIVPNPHQPRAPVDEGELAELAASIAEHGLIQPVIVTQVGNQYQLIAGERRWRAAQQAGLQTIPVILKEATAQQMLELALVENIQRADLNPLEEAAAFRQLMNEFGLTQTEVGVRVGKNRSTISNTIRLLSLPEEIQLAILRSQITEGHGRALLALPNARAQVKLLATVLRRELNVRQTEALVRRELERETEEETEQWEPDADILDLQERLARRLETKVRIRHGKQGGRIVISYYSNEHLQTLLDYLQIDE